MSVPNNPGNCCVNKEIIDVPGVEGEPGTPGAPGVDGVSAFSITTADFTVPAINANVTILVANSTWATVGQNIFVEGAGYFELISKPAATSMTLKYLDYSGNTATGNNIATGAGVSPGGTQPDFSSITALTDNSGGSAGNTIAAGVGRTTLTFYYEAATLANGDVMTDYVPGYKFKILKFDARCAKAVSTGSKAATINLEIGTTNLTGGVISLAGTYAIGAAQAGTAVTGNNTGSATDAFSIEASGVTAFTEGAFVFLIELQNMDTADAVASLADHVNDILAA